MNKQTKRLVEVCPQCCKSINSTSSRLVRDACGHTKCRICFLQEITGCLICATKQNQLPAASPAAVTITSREAPQRKSVITSLAIQNAEQKKSDEPSPLSPIDSETCQLFKQSLEKEILFPSEIAKRSTGNFYHLKRIFSQRFFNEDKNKEHKACETETEWTGKCVEESKVPEKVSGPVENVDKTVGWLIPKHIELRYHCTVHKVSFRQKHNILRNHLTCQQDSRKVKVNSDSYTISCKLCNKTYKAVGKLNRHLKTHTKATKYKCKVCNKFCTDNYNLKTHERSHTKEKPYTCTYCGQKFSSSQRIERHENKHRNEKKFICNDCGFRFFTKSELDCHWVTHTNSKAFICPICHSRFTLKRTMVRHMKTHDANDARFECASCDSTFKRKDNLERHIKISHTDVKTESV